MSRCTTPAVPEDVQGDGRWMSQHCHHLNETKEREPDVLFIGDSIIHQLQLRPVWSEWFEPLHCLNFGISGDCTQHVLWRVHNGELNNINPKVVALCVGTNNFDCPPEETSDGVIEIVKAIRNKLPDAYIVVIDLLPRGQCPNKVRETNSTVNRLVKNKLFGIPKVETVSADKGLIQPDGTISHHDMPDFLHLSDAGYRKCFEPVYDLITQLLFENEKEKDLTPSE